jgi:hypothetical protein
LPELVNEDNIWSASHAPEMQKAECAIVQICNVMCSICDDVMPTDKDYVRINMVIMKATVCSR